MIIYDNLIKGIVHSKFLFHPFSAHLEIGVSATRLPELTCPRKVLRVGHLGERHKERLCVKLFQMCEKIKIENIE